MNMIERSTVAHALDLFVEYTGEPVAIFKEWSANTDDFPEGVKQRSQYSDFSAQKTFIIVNNAVTDMTYFARECAHRTKMGAANIQRVAQSNSNVCFEFSELSASELADAGENISRVFVSEDGFRFKWDAEQCVWTDGDLVFAPHPKTLAPMSEGCEELPGQFKKP